MSRTLGNFELQPGESIQFDAPGAYLYDQSTNENGRCVLTSQRLVFCVYSKTTPAFLIKIFKLKASKSLFEIPLPAILAIEQKEDRRIKLATFHIIHTTGDYTYSFLLANKYTVRWVTSFETAMRMANPNVQATTRDSRIDFA